MDWWEAAIPAVAAVAAVFLLRRGVGALTASLTGAVREAVASSIQKLHRRIDALEDSNDVAHAGLRADIHLIGTNQARLEGKLDGHLETSKRGGTDG